MSESLELDVFTEMLKRFSVLGARSTTPTTTAGAVPAPVSPTTLAHTGQTYVPHSS